MRREGSLTWASGGQSVGRVASDLTVGSCRGTESLSRIRTPSSFRTKSIFSGYSPCPAPNTHTTPVHYLTICPPSSNHTFPQSTRVPQYHQQKAVIINSNCYFWSRLINMIRALCRVSLSFQSFIVLDIKNSSIFDLSANLRPFLLGHSFLLSKSLRREFICNWDCHYRYR